MQISSQFRKPSSPLKQTHQKYITSPPCVPIGCTRQKVGSIHSLETTLHSLQQTYIRPLIHTTQNFKWSRYTLTTLNISQLQTCIHLLETAHPRTTKQLTWRYHTAYSTSQTYHTQSSPKMWTHTPLSTDDHRGQLIADVISNSDHLTLNTPTRVPNTTLQQNHHQISPRCLTLYNRTSWTGPLNTHYHQNTYSSSSQLTYDMTTDHNKTDGLSPTTIKLTGNNSPVSLRRSYPPTYTLRT